MLISSLQMENSCTTSFEYRFLQVLLFFILSTRKVSIGEFCSLIAIAVSESSSHRHSARKATATAPHVQRGSLSCLVINLFLVLETTSYSNASSTFIKLKYMYFLAVYVVSSYCLQLCMFNMKFRRYRRRIVSVSAKYLVNTIALLISLSNFLHFMSL